MKHIKWLWSTIPIAILLFITAGSGVLWGKRIYINVQPFIVAQAFGQDIVSFCLVLPGLIISALFARKGSTRKGSNRSLLIWSGLLAYLVYTYAIASFDVRFNSLFLAYVALLGLSLYALIGGVISAYFGGVARKCPGGVPFIKFTSLFFLVIAILFYLLWLKDIIPALINKTIPIRAADWNSPTYGVHVMDMAIFLPALVITAFQLWRNQPIGCILAGVFLIMLSAMGIALVAMGLSEIIGGYPKTVGKFSIYIILTILFIGISSVYFSKLEE